MQHAEREGPQRALGSRFELPRNGDGGHHQTHQEANHTHQRPRPVVGDSGHEHTCETTCNDHCKRDQGLVPEPIKQKKRNYGDGIKHLIGNERARSNYISIRALNRYISFSGDHGETGREPEQNKSDKGGVHLGSSSLEVNRSLYLVFLSAGYPASEQQDQRCGPCGHARRHCRTPSIRTMARLMAWNASTKEQGATASRHSLPGRCTQPKTRIRPPEQSELIPASWSCASVSCRNVRNKSWRTGASRCATRTSALSAASLS